MVEPVEEHGHRGVCFDRDRVWLSRSTQTDQENKFNSRRFVATIRKHVQGPFSVFQVLLKDLYQDISEVSGS